MVFSSIPFLFCFFPAVLVFYFTVPKSAKNLVLFLFSLLFYGWGEPVYIVIMLFSTVFDYVNGILLERFDGRQKARKVVLGVSVAGNLAILCFFKYADFLVGNINGLFGLSISTLGLPLPIGISFYTFQTMSYTIDVYRRIIPAQKNMISLGMYVALFPQLIAGPIVRYQTIAKEIDNRQETFSDFASGLDRFAVGLCKKVLIANNIGVLWDSVKALPPGQMSVLLSWLGIGAFALQIYFDFSGYSDMAIGLGRMFGFHFNENFRYPYTSKSITEFWRRWHISLGVWFREYVYIPLGGNRKGRARMYFNIFTVWFLTGLWHGASWNFVAWGLYYGLLLLIEKQFLLRFLNKIPAFFSHAYVVAAFLVGWVLFEYTTMGEIFSYLKLLFGIGQVPLLNSLFAYKLLSYGPILAIGVLGATKLPQKIFYGLTGGRLLTIRRGLALIGAMLCLFYLVDSSYNPFLYFRF
jgi:alginate O-acetyltransferase complex protein AlgI